MASGGGNAPRVGLGGCLLWDGAGGPGHLGGSLEAGGCKRSRDATSEASVFISSCSTSPRGTIKEGSNLIKVTQPSAGRHVPPGRPTAAFPVTSLPLPRCCGVLGCSHLVATSLLVPRSLVTVPPGPSGTPVTASLLVP